MKVPTRSVHGFHFVAVELNGRGPFVFLLDTGAGPIVLSNATVRELGSDLSGPRSSLIAESDGNERSVGQVLTVSTLAIDGHIFKKVRAIAMPLPFSLPQSDARIDGILGFGSVADLCVDIDFGTGDVLLFPRRRSFCGGAGDMVPLRVTAGGAPEIAVRIDTREIWMRVDSGSAFGFVLDEALSLPWIRDPSSDEVAVNVLGEEVLRGGHLAEDLRLGRRQLTRPPIHVASRTATHIGMSQLRFLRMTLDVESGRAWIAPSAAPTPTLPPESELTPRLDLDAFAGKGTPAPSRDWSLWRRLILTW